jgi:ribosomal protein S18 acetylase RimI-like enzyme
LGPVARRPSTPADEAFLLAVFASSRERELAALAGEPGLQAQFVRSQATIRRRAYADLYPGSALDVVLIDGVPAGSIEVDRSELGIRLIDIALLPGFRGRGVGGQLLGDLQAEAAARQVPVVLTVEVDNPARRLYDRVGFVTVTATERHLLMRWTPPSPAQANTAS